METLPKNHCNKIKILNSIFNRIEKLYCFTDDYVEKSYFINYFIGSINLYKLRSSVSYMKKNWK